MKRGEDRGVEQQGQQRGTRAAPQSRRHRPPTCSPNLSHIGGGIGGVAVGSVALRLLLLPPRLQPPCYTNPPQVSIQSTCSLSLIRHCSELSLRRLSLSLRSGRSVRVIPDLDLDDLATMSGRFLRASWL